MRAFRFTAVFRVISRFSATFAVCGALCSCTIERAEETILATHANGAKKTSIWVYPNGEILKRNEWYSDGIKEYEIPYKDNEPDGEFKRWTGYGDLVLEGEYKKGLRHGKWISYYGGHFNKKKEAIRYYKEDHPVGDWEGWHFNGEKAFEEHYNEKGDSVGTWKKWNENRTLVEENSCFGNSGKDIETIGPQSFFKRYRPDGTLEMFYTCKYGNKNGISYSYYSDGKKVEISETWKDGRLNGPRTLYYGNGQVQKQEYWKHGIRDSLWIWFDIDGNRIASSIVHNGDRYSPYRVDYGICGSEICAESTFVKVWTENHELRNLNVHHEFVLNRTLWFVKENKSLRYEEIWDKGVLRQSRSFFPDTTNSGVEYTKLANEGFWEGGKRNGIWRNWYKNGVLKDSLTYVNGERVGEQFGYDSTGKLTIHKTENGKNRPVIMHILGSER